MRKWVETCPSARSSTTITGMLAVIAPTPPAMLPWSWAAAKRIAPEAAFRSASAGVPASPSNRAAAHHAAAQHRAHILPGDRWPGVQDQVGRHGGDDRGQRGGLPMSQGQLATIRS